MGWEFVTVEAEDLANEAFPPVSDDGAADATRNGESESGGGIGVPNGVDYEHGIADHPSASEDVVKVSLMDKSKRFRKGVH